MARISFESWQAVQEYCANHAWVYYKAPLDVHPSVIAVFRVFKNGKIRLAGPFCNFTADKNHLGRFSRNT